MGAVAANAGRTIGRYVVFDEIASGGMATIHFGRLMSAVGITRTVAIKRLHPHLAKDHDFVQMFLDEARIAARIRHPNVVGVLDVVHEEDELFLVMDYVQGETLSRLWRAVRPGVVPVRIAVTALVGVLHGLHAAHEATDDFGRPLHIVHRDVSPQNVMLGTDGVARVLDFGVAKAVHRVQSTQDGSLKGKIAYMSPEQILGDAMDRRSDVYAAAVVLWETVTGERLFEADSQGRTVRKILDEPVPAPSTRIPGLPAALDEAIMRGLERNIDKRWQTARDFAGALERAMTAASATEIGEWVEAVADSTLGERAMRVKEIESRSNITATAPVTGERKRDAATTEVEIDVTHGEPTTAPHPLQVKTVVLDQIPRLPQRAPAPAQLSPITPQPMPRQLHTVALDVQGQLLPPPTDPVLRGGSRPDPEEDFALEPVRSGRRNVSFSVVVVLLVAGLIGLMAWLMHTGRL